MPSTGAITPEEVVAHAVQLTPGSDISGPRGSMSPKALFSDSKLHTVDSARESAAGTQPHSPKDECCGASEAGDGVPGDNSVGKSPAAASLHLSGQSPGVATQSPQCSVGSLGQWVQAGANTPGSELVDQKIHTSSVHSSRTPGTALARDPAGGQAVEASPPRPRPSDTPPSSKTSTPNHSRPPRSPLQPEVRPNGAGRDDPAAASHGQPRPATMPQLTRTMSRIRQAVSRGATPGASREASRPLSPRRSVDRSHHVSWAPSEGTHTHSASPHPAADASANVMRSAPPPPLPPAPRGASPARSHGKPGVGRAASDAAMGPRAMRMPYVSADEALAGRADMATAASGHGPEAEGTPQLSRASSGAGHEAGKGRHRRRQRSGGRRSDVLFLVTVAAVASVCAAGVLLGLKFVLDGRGEHQPQVHVVERVMVDPMGAPRVDSMDMEVLRQLTEMQRMLETAPRPVRQPAAGGAATPSAQHEGSGHDKGGVPPTEGGGSVAGGASSTVVTLLGLIPSEALTFAVVVGIIIGIPMVYMYRMDRAQTATDMAREPSAAGSRSDAGGMERRRSSLSKRLSLRSSLGGGHARHDAVRQSLYASSNASELSATGSMMTRRGRSRSMISTMTSAEHDVRRPMVRPISRRASRLSAMDM